MTSTSPATLFEVNHRLRSLAAKHRPIIVVHRGASGGSIAENTGKAFQAALRLGGDLIETDVIGSSDGDYFLFHNGYEAMHFGLESDIRSLTTAQMRELQYKWCIRQGTEPYGLEPLDSILDGFSEAIFMIDRSWHYWPHLLQYVSGRGVTDRLLFKCPAQAALLDKIAGSPEPFPFVPIVRTLAELDAVLAHSDLNLVGVELLAENPNDDLARPEVITRLHNQGLLVQLNALNLGNRRPLFIGWDDEVSVLRSPDLGWGRLIAHGADMVQTDWPSLLRDYRNGIRT